jgi:hypothetical protein
MYECFSNRHVRRHFASSTHRRGLFAAAGLRQGGEETMTWELIVGAILGLAALGYVLVALIDPERFS